MDENQYQLYADELTEEDRTELITLDCGNKPWGRAATEWMIGSEVWDSIRNRSTRVWLYRNNRDVLVGFGSLGITRRKWPPPDGGYSNLLILPMLGLDHRYHGQPPTNEFRYSNQILSHLRYEAITLYSTRKNAGKSTLPLLSLFVHQDNLRAISLYKKFGFTQHLDANRNDLLLMSQRIAADE